MTPAKVLIVDDSGVVRRLVAEALAGVEGLELAGSAANGADALARIRALAPDLMTLDVEMPGMSGLELLDQVRRVAPELRVVMFSASTHAAAKITLEALARGASDHVAKPSGLSRAAAIEQVRRELVPRLLALAARRRSGTVAALRAPAPAGARKTGSPRAEVLAVGASTGGPSALAELFRGFSGPLAVPVLVVQHTGPQFTRLLAERLASVSRLRFTEAQHGQVLAPGLAVIAPGERHLRVGLSGGRRELLLGREPPENGCRPSVDALLRSVALAYGDRALGVVLTGLGEDGLRGAKEIKDRGGQVLVQDEESSVVWGMPGRIAKAGLADAILSLADLRAEILQRLVAREVRPGAALGSGGPHGQ